MCYTSVTDPVKQCIKSVLFFATPSGRTKKELPRQKEPPQRPRRPRKRRRTWQVSTGTNTVEEEVGAAPTVGRIPQVHRPAKQGAGEQLQAGLPQGHRQAGKDVAAVVTALVETASGTIHWSTEWCRSRGSQGAAATGFPVKLRDLHQDEQLEKRSQCTWLCPNRGHCAV